MKADLLLHSLVSVALANSVALGQFSLSQYSKSAGGGHSTRFEEVVYGVGVGDAVLIDTGEADTIDMGGAGSFPGANPYPSGDTAVEQTLVRALATVTIPEGDYSLACGSDDGCRISIPGVEFTGGFGNSPSIRAGGSEVWFDGNRSHNWTGASFSVGAGGLETVIDASFHEAGGGDSWELAIYDNSAGDVADAVDGNNLLVDDWELLEDGVLGWGISPTDSRGKDNELPTLLQGVAGDDLGETLLTPLLDVAIGPPKRVQGLAQWWYNGNKRNNQDFFNAAREGDTTDLANPSGSPFTTPNTWWSGNGDRTISGIALDRYPSPELAGGRFDMANNENYGVRLFGDIFIPENGVYRVRDGIDGYTMVAIDLDGDGLNEDDFPFSNEDSPIGDVIIHDDDTANWDGGSNDGPNGPFGIARFEGIRHGGSWREIEIWMSEGGGADAGIIYMANEEDENLNHEQWDVAGGLDASQRDMFLIPPDHLRYVIPSVIISGTARATLETGTDEGAVNYVMNVSSDLLDSDHIIVRNPGGAVVTQLDVTDATIAIEAQGDLVAGDEWVLFGADELIGEETITWVVDDPTLWDFRGLSNDGDDAHRIMYTGFIEYGPLDNNGDGVVDGGDLAGACDAGNVAELLAELGTVAGDLDGNGVVEFPDFLTLSGNFNATGVEYSGGDIDCSGTVEFQDFLALSSEFTVGAIAVPEPVAAGILTAALVFTGLARRRSPGLKSSQRT